MDQDARLIGRDAEQRALETLLAAASGGTSGAMLLSGEAGIGKTALLDHAVDRASGLLVLGTEGVEPEADLPFAGLHRLLRPVMDLVGSLPTSQAGALGAALGLDPVAGGRVNGAVDRFLIGAGVLSLLAEAAEQHGVLCVVDNTQWLDQESVDALGFAARRLDAEGVLMLFAAREGFTVPGLATRSVGPLPAEAVHRLLGTVGLPVAPAVRDRIVELSGGNPLAALELPRALNDAQRSGAEPVPGDLDPGERIRAAWLSRVAGLPEPARRLLLVAAADPTADLGVVGRVADGMGLAVEDLEPAERAGLVSASPDGVRFESPLLRSAVYADAGFLGRRTVHAALAEAFHGSHPDRWAWHRAAIAEAADPVLADELERLAERASARTGYAATASALERSAELTAAGPLRRRRLVSAASAAWSAGQAQRADRLLTAAETASSESPDPRVALIRGKMEAFLGRPASAVTTLRAAARDLAENHPDLAIEALTTAMEAAAIAGDFSQAPALAELASSLTGGRRFPLIDLLTAIAHLVEGDPASAAVLLRTFLGHAETAEDPARLAWGAVAGIYLGDEEAARRLYDRAIDRARDTGTVSLLPFLLEQRGMGEWSTGQLGFAEGDATESVRLTEELGRVRPALLAMATLTDVAAKRGRVEEARDLGARTVSAAEQYGVGLAIDMVVTALMEMDLAQGRADAALERALRLERDEGGRVTHPLVKILTTPTRVEILSRSGRPVPPEELERYRQWVTASPGPSYPALLARCEALVAAPEAAASAYEQALRLHEVADRPFDLARTRLLYGELLRRQRRPGQAREHLRAATEAFTRIGCVLWAERARAELRAAGETDGEPQDEAFGRLSPQETQIVRMVGEGMSNREVAGQLFLSPRTVEYHLYKAYPKLGISSRSELVRLAATASQ